MNDLLDFKIYNKNDLEILFTDTGAVQSINYKNIMINQLQGNNIDGCFNNIYLRVFDGKRISFIPMISSNSVFAIAKNKRAAHWNGFFKGVEYKCACHISSELNLWFWTVDLENSSDNNLEVDIVYVQDLGLADKGAVRTNEAYVSQYIDHAVFEDEEYGYVICSRQNQPQSIDGNSAFPWILQGGFSKIKGFLTDGFQFFGLDYKEDNIPAALENDSLPNSKLQYEIAMGGLQTEKIYLERGAVNRTSFYAFFLPDHDEPSTDLDLDNVSKIRKIYHSHKKHHENLEYRPAIAKNFFKDAELFESDKFLERDIDSIFGKDLIHEEMIDGKLVSFFYSDNRHVVLKEKENYVERPHGHIMMSGCSVDFRNTRLSTTSYIYGLFNSLVSIGNTSFSRIISGTRNPLNVFKSSGQRIFVKLDGEYELLALPSAFEIGKNYCRWFYKSGDVMIKITSWTGVAAPSCYLDIEIEGDEELEFLISHEVVGGSNERDLIPDIRFDRKSCITAITPNSNELILTKFPETKYYLVPGDKKQIDEFGGSELLYFGSGIVIEDEPYAVYKTKPVKAFQLKITGSLVDEIGNLNLFENYSEAVSVNDEFWNNLVNNFKLELNGTNKNYTKFNDIIKAYAHNAMVHFLVPHGLEQYNGAAWGVRDVCQGPIEFFLSTNNFGPVRQILMCLFTHQYKQRGDWPQWHMFDAFSKFQQKESHGDVIVWPLKALFDYIDCSGDFSILKEDIAFTDIESLDLTAEKVTLLEHVKVLVNSIKNNFIKGTSLSCYGDGDWDDTLQPANSDLRKNMVSGWTVQLSYQAFKKAGDLLALFGEKVLSAELLNLCDSIKRDYNKYVIKDNVAAGFLYFNHDNSVEHVIHPSDRKTGIHYRLLPMTRGMISELFDKKQADEHYDLISRHLYCPDGVRLMDNPAQYIGGPNKFFKRAEQAANFGREIGLQYVHAHIRFIEAMAKLGKADDVYKGLLAINPINISSFVKNAKTRQSNAYFSSSDGEFADRYEAQENFEKLKVGEIPVKGGWRIYSSGPGIYINQLITNMLGFRVKSYGIQIDPVIPKSLNGLKYSFTYNDKTINICYHIDIREFAPSKIEINGKETDFKKLSNPYRYGGLEIDSKLFNELLCEENNIINVYM